MTLIAAKIELDGTVWIAADSLGVSDYDLTVRGDEKVFRLGPYVVGFTTSFRFGQIIRHHVELPDIPASDRGHKHISGIIDILHETLYKHKYAKEAWNVRTGGQLIIGWAGHLYMVDSDFQYDMPLLPYWCIGAASGYGLGCLWSEHKRNNKSVRLQLLSALRAATEFSVIGPPFIMLSTDGQRKVYKR